MDTNIEENIDAPEVEGNISTVQRDIPSPLAELVNLDSLADIIDDNGSDQENLELPDENESDEEPTGHEEPPLSETMKDVIRKNASAQNLRDQRRLYMNLITPQLISTKDYGSRIREMLGVVIDELHRRMRNYALDHPDALGNLRSSMQHIDYVRDRANDEMERRFVTARK